MTFIRKKQINYSYAFRRLYKMIEESSDENFMRKFKETFNMNDIEYRSLVSDVKSFRKREQEEWESKTETIAELQEELKSDRLTKHQRFKAIRRIARLSRGINRESTFGSRYLLKCITRECNRTIRNEVKIERLRNEFRSKRIIPFMIMGEANQKGNRFFDLSGLTDKQVVYKPYKGMKIVLTVNITKGLDDELKRLVEMALRGEISVTIRLSDKYLYLTYDEEILNGYGVDEVSRRRDVKDIKEKRHPKEVEKELIKELYKTYYDKQHENKLKGRIKGRCIAIDMNPTNVGFSVLEVRKDKTVKLLYKGLIDLSRLCIKTGKSSSDLYSKYLTNKRHYEITMAVKKLFNIAEHYHCAMFVIEDLELNGKLSREANRKVNNVWNRELFVGCINRRCNERGIELVKVNPCYSSFIGNIEYPYADACNASIEIGRRGIMRYMKGGFYPDITSEDIHTLEAKFGDVVACSTDCGWANIHKSLKNSFDDKEFSHRLRTGIDEVKVPYTSFSMNSYKSNIKVIIFN